jgi:hypothetical protein
MSLYRKCRTIFLKCNQFQTNVSLRSIFAWGKLSTLLTSVPDGGSLEERVDNLLSFLSNRSFSDGTSALECFIDALQERYQPDQEIYEELRELRIEIDQQLLAVVEIPIVIVAMTEPEADEIRTENIINRQDIAKDKKEQLKLMNKICLEHDANWPTHYRAERDEWIPFNGIQQSIRQIVWNIAAKANERRLENGNIPILRPSFVSSEFFSSDVQIRSYSWEKLRKSGGLVIVDSLSLYYPLLKNLLNRSHVTLSRDVALIVLYPVELNNPEVNNFVEHDIQREMEMEFLRFADHFDRSCEIGVGSSYSLYRWLFNIFLDTAETIEKRRPRVSNIERIRQLMGEPVGIDQLIFGKEGAR